MEHCVESREKDGWSVSLSDVALTDDHVRQLVFSAASKESGDRPKLDLSCWRVHFTDAINTPGFFIIDWNLDLKECVFEDGACFGGSVENARYGSSRVQW